MTSIRSVLATVVQDPGRIPGAVSKRLHQLGARSAALQGLRGRRQSRQEVFSEIYGSQAWGSSESGSGTGSELRATADIRDSLPELLTRLGAKSILDAPCGDWNWMRHVQLPVEQYYGADIVPSVIESVRSAFDAPGREFLVADLTTDELPKAEVILCRDCLVHVSYQDAKLMLENFRRTGATWLLVNTYPEVQRNHNQFTGRHWRRLNFELAPFEFGEPVQMLPDGGDVDPSQLALYRLQELPTIQV